MGVKVRMTHAKLGLVLFCVIQQLVHCKLGNLMEKNMVQYIKDIMDI